MKKNTKKLLLPLFLMALIFTTAKLPLTPPPAVPEDGTEQVMPLSDMEPDPNTNND